MIDYVEIFLGNELLKDLDKSALHFYKGNLYGLKEQISVGIDVKLKFAYDENKSLRIFGSIPYAINGNSFQPINTAELRDFFEWLSALIKVEVLKGQIRRFEAGAVMEVPEKYCFYSHNHVGFEGMDECNKQKDRSKVFSDNEFRSVKFYNARRNVTLGKVSLSVRNKLVADGILDLKKEYVKFEVVYLKPATVFKVPVFTVETLLDEEITEKIKVDVLNTYKTAKNTGYSLDETNGKPDTIDLLLAVVQKLSKLSEVDGQNIIKETIKEIPCFRPWDRYDKNKLIDSRLEKIKSDENPADLYDLLCKKFGV